MNKTKPVPVYGTIEWRMHQYERMKEENRSHNYRYWNEKWWKEQEAKGWKIHQYPDEKIDKEATSWEQRAIDTVAEYRKTGYYASIIAGYAQNKQRVKMFTVIYKNKSK